MFDIDEIGGHIRDSNSFHLPFGIQLDLPAVHLGPWDVAGYPLEYQFQLTKFMVLEVVAAALMVAIFVPLAWRMRGGGPPRGPFWNLFEFVLVFLRDQVARPAIGRRDADRFMPFLWTLFFFVLFCNVMGLIPWGASPTASLSVTAVLALISFATSLGTGMRRHGPLGYWRGLVPPVDVPLGVAILLKPLLFLIEVSGLAIKYSVLAVRLLANMFAGHLVLAVIVTFIGAAANALLPIWMGVTLASVVAAAALSGLELFFGLLQAYIFTFLSAVFIGMAVHQH
jgi:F-type H+-transporting ATPase subunit a